MTHTSRYTKSIIHSASKKIGATCHGSRNLFVTRTSRAAHPPARLAASDTEKEHWPAPKKPTGVYNHDPSPPAL